MTYIILHLSDGTKCVYNALLPIYTINRIIQNKASKIAYIEYK